MENFDNLCLNSGHLRKISIPSTGFVETHVVYHIDVSLYDYSWTVERRYREFFELHEKLTKQFPTLQKKLTLPPKKFLGNFDPLHVEKRRQLLENYLRNIVTELGKIPRALQTFLEFHIYDVLAVTQTLAEKLFVTGDSILANEEVLVVSPLQLYCISKRLKLPIPTCGGEDYGYDVGNLYDIVFCIQSLKIVEDDKHSLNNSSEENISYDLSLFRNLKTLQISKCSIESLQGTYHLQQNLQKLSVHNSLHLLKDILIDQDVWSHDSCEEVLKQGGSVIMTWKHLTAIDFSHNDIPYIDESVTLLHELVRLDLSYNKIQEIAHLQDLPNLRELNLSFNQIENLKFVNTKLGNIASLRLAGNRLHNVGDLSKMFSLVNLDLSENSIDDINDVMSLGHLPCLENLILLANPVRHQATFRTQLLAAFEDRVSQICLDQMLPTQAEIKTVMTIIAEENRYEVVNLPYNSTSGCPKKNKTGHKKAPGRRIKIATRDVLKEAEIGASSVPVRPQTTTTEDDKKFRDRVDRIRQMGGDGWLGLLNEIQNENESKDISKHTRASLPRNMGTTVQNSENITFCGHSDLKFGFSAELENLVNLTMKEDNKTLTGPFIVNVEARASSEEERMVDLKNGVLMEIVIDTNEISRKYNLDEISSVDILESSDSWYVDLLQTEHKEFRRHTDFYANSDDSKGKFRQVAKYRMRSMKDAAELFVLLYKIVSDYSSVRSPQRSSSVLSQTSQKAVANGDNTIYSNPIGLKPDVFHQFLDSKLGCPTESDLTESTHHATENKSESAHLILWVSCLPYALPDHELPVCLVLTNANVYLFNLVKVVSVPRKVEQLEKILALMCCVPLSDLCSVVRGVFDLTFRLEFANRGQHGTFTFLTRDSEMTESFVKVLEELTASYAGSYNIVNTSELRLDKLKREISLSCGKIFKDDECVLLYAVVRELSEVTSSDDVLSKPSKMTSSISGHVTSTTRSLVLTNWNLFLCEEDHLHWPLPGYMKDAPSTPQWVVTKHGDVKHIIGIEVYDVTGECAFVGTSGMCILLENSSDAPDEDASRDTNTEYTSRGTEIWNVIFKLKEEREQFQRSLSQIWSYNFHGELQTTQSKPICAKNIHHSPRIDLAAHFFQEEFASSGADDLQNRTGKSHRRNASGHFHPVHNEDSARTSMEVLHNANAEVLERFFNETLRHKCGNDDSEILVSYAWTGCVAYMYPTREVHVWLVLSSSKVYIVADLQDREIIGDALEVIFGTSTRLSFNWLPLATLRQVCVGFFDQTIRLETDNPKSTFTFITRDYQVTSCFLENLKSAFKEIGTERPAPRASSDHSPSIYDSFLSSSEIDNEHSLEEKIYHSKGVVKFVYPSDDTVEILKHSVWEYAKESEYFKFLDDISILLYLLMFQIVEGRKLCRTFMVLNNTLCTCVENHVNFPLPLFVKDLPVCSRYEIQCLRLITDIKRIEFSGFNSQDFTIVYKKEQILSVAEKAEKTGKNDLKSSACREGEERWTMIAQTYEEKEKALGMILKIWKEKVGEDLPVLKI